eukprot:10136544-Prorocentrum_lima.AAC.1
MTSSLVGSEMCIRDRQVAIASTFFSLGHGLPGTPARSKGGQVWSSLPVDCLLYTSDAADDM